MNVETAEEIKEINELIIKDIENNYYNEFVKYGDGSGYCLERGILDFLVINYTHSPHNHIFLLRGTMNKTLNESDWSDELRTIIENIELIYKL